MFGKCRNKNPSPKRETWAYRVVARKRDDGTVYYTGHVRIKYNNYEETLYSVVVSRYENNPLSGMRSVHYRPAVFLSSVNSFSLYEIKYKEFSTAEEAEKKTIELREQELARLSDREQRRKNRKYKKVVVEGHAEEE